jgi:hypothetical protein
MATPQEVLNLMKKIFNSSIKGSDMLSPFDDEMLLKILLSLPDEELGKNLLVKKLSPQDMEAFYILRALWVQT